MNNMWRIHPCKEKYVEIPPYNDKCEKSLPAMKNMWRMVLDLFAKGSNVRDFVDALFAFVSGASLSR